MIQLQRLIPWFLVTAVSVLGACGDWYLVSICRFDDTPQVCKQGPDGMIPTTPVPDGGTIPDLANVPPGPESTFLALGSETALLMGDMKWAGIRDDGRIVFTKKNSNLPNTYSFLAMKMENRMFTPKACADCPINVGGIDRNKDFLLVSNALFFRVKSGDNGLVEQLDVNGFSAKKIYPISNIDVIPSKIIGVRPFVHPKLNVIVFQQKNDTQSSITSAYYQHGSVESNPRSHPRTEEPKTTYAFADLDSIDPTPNGMEFLIFEGNTLAALTHTDNGAPDAALFESIQQAIRDASPMGDLTNIDSAFISNLNRDQYMDLIFVRTGTVYVTSYLGRNSVTKIPKFQKWATPIIILTPADHVISLAVGDMSGDGKPDIAIETEDKVYFYLNTP